MLSIKSNEVDIRDIGLPFIAGANKSKKTKKKTKKDKTKTTNTKKDKTKTTNTKKDKKKTKNTKKDKKKTTNTKKDKTNTKKDKTKFLEKITNQMNSNSNVENDSNSNKDNSGITNTNEKSNIKSDNNSNIKSDNNSNIELLKGILSNEIVLNDENEERIKVYYREVEKKIQLGDSEFVLINNTFIRRRDYERMVYNILKNIENAFLLAHKKWHFTKDEKKTEDFKKKVQDFKKKNKYCKFQKIRINELNQKLYEIQNENRNRQSEIINSYKKLKTQKNVLENNLSKTQTTKREAKRYARNAENNADSKKYEDNKMKSMKRNIENKINKAETSQEKSERIIEESIKREMEINNKLDKAAADKAAADKAAVDKAVADKAAADKAAVDKAVADKVEADKVADKATADKAAADKVEADKVAADKVADKATADKAAADKVEADKVAADKVEAEIDKIFEPDAEIKDVVGHTKLYIQEIKDMSGTIISDILKDEKLKQSLYKYINQDNLFENYPKNYQDMIKKKFINKELTRKSQDSVHYQIDPKTLLREYLIDKYRNSKNIDFNKLDEYNDLFFITDLIQQQGGSSLEKEFKEILELVRDLKNTDEKIKCKEVKKNIYEKGFDKYIKEALFNKDLDKQEIEQNIKNFLNCAPYYIICYKILLNSDLINEGYFENGENNYGIKEFYKQLRQYSKYDYFKVMGIIIFFKKFIELKADKELKDLIERYGIYNSIEYSTSYSQYGGR